MGFCTPMVRTMKAVVYESFGETPSIQEVPDPTPPDGGVVFEVEASGLCRSDWHGWMGHDPNIKLPHVPGHELAGVVMSAGKSVRNWKTGDRVTVPFVCGCGACPQCDSGNHQVCDHQFQPGFSHWGSFAQYVVVNYADVNLVRLPADMDFVTAACLGCRFVTAYRAVVDRGMVSAGQWVAVHGCGGVGNSAIMIAKALGAHVVAVDISDDKLAYAKSMGAVATVNGASEGNVAEAVRDFTGGGVHVSIDAYGSTVTCNNSVASLRKRGTHIQVGLMVGDDARAEIQMDIILAHELKILGSHGMAAHHYPPMLQMIKDGRLSPHRLIGSRIKMDQCPERLVELGTFSGVGMTVITEF